MTQRVLSGDLPLISIITVVYNGIESCEQTIQSSIDQTYLNKEIIVIDGGSTDGSVEIIKKYSPRIKYWISEPDKGIYDAMNKGIQQANGQWINFMNCGDRFATPEILEYFAMLQLENADLVYGDAIMEYPSFQKIYPKYSVNKIWKAMPFCHQALFTRTSVLKESPFNLKFKLSADYDLIYRAALSNARFFYFDRVVCYFSFTDGASKKDPIRSINERKAIALHHEFRWYRWLYYFCLITYLRVAFFAKKILGNKLTAWLTRLIRA